MDGLIIDILSPHLFLLNFFFSNRESKEMESPEISMPEDLREGKDRMIFGNVEMIYEWHRE